MARVLVIDDRASLAELLAQSLRASPAVAWCARAAQPEDGFGGALAASYGGALAAQLAEQAVDTVVYAPSCCGARQMTPDLVEAAAVFAQCAQAGLAHFILLSSAQVYGATPHNPGLLSETRPPARNGHNPLGGQWAELEALAAQQSGAARLTILRPVAVLTPDSADYFSRLLTGKVACVLPGHDPSLQFLSAADLARAVVGAVERSAGGIYNIAPDGVLPLRQALRLAGVMRVPMPRTWQRLARAALAPFGWAHTAAQLDFIRYSWTVSNQKSKDELGFAPQHSSAAAVLALTGKTPASGVAASEAGFDDFGLDEGYIAAFGRTLFAWLSRYYWRIEVDGMNHVPRAGRAVLVGTHRGFMPWDAVMALHLVKQQTARIPRFLIHPGLIKFPFLFNFHTKLGGLIACQENADYVLAREGLLAIYPEGINGAFRLYREAYQLGKFGRDEYVKMALRNRAPIIPFVNVGSAEIFPILKRLDWRWWKRWTDWPFFPLTPTWPLAPLPLPSKWHVQFLPPIPLEHYGPEAADDPATVRAISQEVRAVMAAALAQLVERRKHIFYGSVFERGLESELRG